MTPALALLPLLLGVACGPKDAPVQAAPQAAALPLDEGPPAVAAPAPWTPPQPTVRTLSNGSPLWVLERPGLPLVSLRVVVPGGRAADPADRPGLTSLADDMLLRGAGDRDAQAFAAAMDQLAIDLYTDTRATETIIGLDAHAGRLDAALDLLADALLRPRFDKAEVARLVELRQGDLAVELTDPRSVGSIVLDRAWYGEGHPLAHRTEGTPDSLPRLRARDAAQSWQARRAAGAPTLIVVGELDADALAAGLEARLAAWKGAPAARVVTPTPTPAPRRVLVHNPEAAQTMLMLAMPAPAQGDPTVEAARLAAVALGGTFTSRLNRKLREEKGYTYGARASLADGPDHGRLVISTAVQRDVTAPALADLLAELERVHQDLAAPELDKARGAQRTDLVEGAGSRADLASTYAAVAASGRAPGALASRLQAQEGVTVEATLAALGGARLDQATLVVVGDLDAIRGPVTEALPGEWIELSALGEPLP